MPSNKYFRFEEGKKILTENCHDSLKDSEVDLADFTFRNAIQALTFAAYTNSIIPIDDKVGFQPTETGGIGAGDVSNQFYKNILILRGLDRLDVILDPRLGTYTYSLHEIFSEFGDYLEEEKHLVFVKRTSVAETVRSILESGLKPSNFVLHVSDGTLGEEFYNYPVIEHFKHLGYFVGFWTPRYGADLIAVRIPEYQKQLEEHGFIGGGASFFELELAPLQTVKLQSTLDFLNKYDMVYMEVEARMNLALRGSQTGIGQISGKASSKSEGYGVGPVSDTAGYIPRPGEKFGDRYKFVSYGPPERLGAIIFDGSGKMVVINPGKQGFEEEDETISDYKNFLKTIFLSKLPIRKAEQLMNAYNLDEFIKKTQIIEFSTILTALKQ